MPLRSGPSLFPPLPTSGSEIVTGRCDGGARGNPGPAGYGAVLTDAQGNVVAELSEFLGIRTNNFAEYSGLLATLAYALEHGHRRLRVISDSELMVKQIQGRYKVSSPDLRPLWQEAKTRIAKLDWFEIAHALRHKNKDADRLANEAMDRGMKRGAPPEGTPRQGGRAVESLPLRAIPYAPRGEAPPAPAQLDPASERAPAPTAPPPAPSASPTMLRGFTRDGAIHLLGGHTLPDGVFVKIIPE